MAHSTVDPTTELGRTRRDGRVPGWPAGAVVWGGSTILVGAAGSAVGLTTGQHLQVTLWPDAVRTMAEMNTVLLMTVLVGMIGLLVGGTAGLLLHPSARVAAGFRGGLGFAVVGGFCGGLGPLLNTLSGGRLPLAGGFVLGCGLAGGIAGLVGYTFRPSRPKPGEISDDWAADPDLVDCRTAVGRVAASSSVASQWPILAISTGCLIVAMVTPVSPAGWPMLAVGLLGFAVVWVLAGQDRRLRALERQLRDQTDAEETVGSSS
jgi:hypothetical protein